MNLVVKESFHKRTLLSTTERQVNSACVMLEGKTSLLQQATSQHAAQAASADRLQTLITCHGSFA